MLKGTVAAGLPSVKGPEAGSGFTVFDCARAATSPAHGKNRRAAAVAARADVLRTCLVIDVSGSSPLG
jgi:hypothetical protein